MGQVKMVTGSYANQPDVIAEGMRLLNRGFEEARHLDDPETYWFISSTWLIYSSPVKYALERQQLVDEMLDRSRAGASVMTAGVSIAFVVHVLLESGQRQRAEKLFIELKELAERSGQIHLLAVSLALEGVFATIDGRLEEAVDISQRVRTFCEEIGMEIYGIVVGGIAGSRALFFLGKADEALAFMAPIGMEKLPLSAAFHANCGRYAEASALLDQYLAVWGSIDPEQCTGIPTTNHVTMLEAAIMTEHRPAAEWLQNFFARYSVPTTGIYYITCIPCQLGGAAAFLGRYDEARKYYQEAIKVCTEMTFRPELALSKLQFAELLLEHYPDEKKEALEHLDFAIKEFREMKMQPSLERALRHKDILKA